MDDKSFIIKMRQYENAGLGRIFRKLRGMKYLEYVGDFILYKRIVLCLRQNGFIIAESSVVRHFKNISSNDYDESEKRMLLKDLRQTA